MTDRSIPPIRGKKKIQKKGTSAVNPEKGTSVVNPVVKDNILERVAREEKAYRIVERLMDNPVSSQLLQKSLKYINQDVYNDIVEERSIVKNCGYPLCQNSLPKTIRKQTYAINTRINKVYKLEERVKFCSSLCFSISRNLRDQLSPEPVWLMLKSAHKNITVMPLKIEESDKEELPKNQKIDEKHLREEVELSKCLSVKERVLPKSATQSVFKEMKPLQNIAESVQDQFSWLSLEDEGDISEEEGEKVIKLPDMSFIGTIRHCLMQWKTARSSAFLAGTKIPVPDSDDDADLLDDDLLDNDLTLSPPENKAPLPHISDLETDTINIKESDATEQQVHLPKIDSINQVQQRQNIVVLKLQNATERILAATSYRYCDISSPVIKLVSLLNISSSNCMFYEKQWSVIAAVMLSTSFPMLTVLQTSYNQDQFTDYLWGRVRYFLDDKPEFLELCDSFR